MPMRTRKHGVTSWSRHSGTWATRHNHSRRNLNNPSRQSLSACHQNSVSPSTAPGSAVERAEAVDVALSLAKWFVASGGVSDGRGRMAAHIAGGAKLPDALAG